LDHRTSNLFLSFFRHCVILAAALLSDLNIACPEHASLENALGGSLQRKSPQGAD
jgi:hypothetical protein